MRNRILFPLLLIFWFIVNLFSAAFTEVLSDEAYYGLFGKYLAWGYFDHPPMVGLMARLSSIFFSGNLGLRFMSVLFGTGTLYLIWRIIQNKEEDKNKVLDFFIIAGSLCMFSAYGFLITPDVPLLFFTALLLLSYQRFLTDQNWKYVIMLSISGAGLIYSKYHGILVIGLIVLSNLKLLKTFRFWVACLIALILLSPHIWWQISNDYPSFRFQLFERADGFQWANFLQYIPNQIAVFNPLVLGAAIYIIVKWKPGDIFVRALYFLIIGFELFFCIASLRGHIEPHWTVAASVAMIILIYNKSVTETNISAFVRKALFPSFLLLLIVRVIVISDLPFIKKAGLKGKNEKFEFIHSVAKDVPVIFLGSFPNPALYSYFTGKVGIPINSLYTRKTQYDLWQFERNYHNKPAFIFSFGEGDSKSYEKNGIQFYGFFTDSLQTVNHIKVSFVPHVNTLVPGDTISFSVALENPYPFDISFSHHKFPVELVAAFVKNDRPELYPLALSDKIGIIRSGEKLTRLASFSVPAIEPGRYRFGLTLNNQLGPAINDSFSEIEVIK